VAGLGARSEWFTDASFVGFRVVSPVKQPTKAEIEAYFKLPPDDL
jgi:hypothetical protein